MGVVDDFKSEKNRSMIVLATEKMLKDKYDIIIEKEELNILINNVVFTICSDVSLIKSVVKIMELNTVALTKVKEYIDAAKTKKESESSGSGSGGSILEEKRVPPTDEDVAKYNSEELLTKVLQLEEKRNAINALAKTQMNNPELSKDILDANSTASMTAPIQASAPLPQLPQLSQLSLLPNQQAPLSQLSQLSQQQAFHNINMYTMIEKLDDVINRKKYINYKSLVINSYNRNWISYPQRNKLSLSVNIDFSKNLIEPDKLLLPQNIKNKTPYITMIISDGKQSQKFQFIASGTASGYAPGDFSGTSWDTWVLLNSDREYSRNIILLTNKNWHISFTDYLNKDLDMGRDCIKIATITKCSKSSFDVSSYISVKPSFNSDGEDANKEADEADEAGADGAGDDGADGAGDDVDDEYNYYSITISKNEYDDLRLVNKNDTLLLGSDDGTYIPIKVLVRFKNNLMKISVEKQYEIMKDTRYYLLNYKGQYTIILSYYSKV